MRQRAYATSRAVVAVATSVALSFGLGGLVLAGTAGAAEPYVATNAVNVRSGPGTSYRVIGVLALGKPISGTATSSGWVKVSFKGGAGYVWGGYLKKAATATTSPSTSAETTGKAGTKVTTADVNVRTGPGLDSSIVKVLPKGSTVSTTGTMSERWAEVTIEGAAYWVSSTYLADPSTTSPSLPAIKYTAVTTAVLAMRKTPEIGASSAGDLKAGSTVSLTGTHSGSYSQIVHQSAVVWVLTGYLNTSAAGPAAPALPKSAGKRYVSVDEVNIRATSAADGKVIDTVELGTVLLITGKTANKRSEVIFGGAVRWAYSAYLSKTKPSSSAEPAPTTGDDLGSETLNRTNAYAHVIVKRIRDKFPQIKTIYGWRMSSAYSSDHPKGRALDLMIPSYKSSSGKVLGDKIARYLQDNYKTLHVHYLIWRQRQWNVERNTNVTTGWRKMSDRGSDNDNHMNHVHVTVYDVK